MTTLSLQKSIKDNAEELQDYIRDLNSWVKDVNEEEKSLMMKTSEISNHQNLPPIRGATVEKTTNGASTNKKAKIEDKINSKRISSYDYEAWDKFNVDKAMESDSEYDTKTCNKDESKQKTKNALKSSLQKLTSEEKAERFKEEGNKCYSEGKFPDAVAKYTQGIALNPSNALLPANRAMTYIKMKKYKAAEKDCTRSIDLDSSYIKSYMRRATARVHLENLSGAIEDYKKVLSLEPWNKEAKKELENIRSKSPEKENSSNEIDHPIQLSSNPTDFNEKVSSVKSINKDLKKIQIREVRSEIKSESSQFSNLTKPRHEESMVPLVTVPIVEVNSRAEIDAIINPSASSDDAKTTVVHGTNNDSKCKQIEAVPKKNDSIPKKPVLPRIPRTSHQFCQDWIKIKNHEDLKIAYLKTIPASFFYGTEIEVDLMVEVVQCLCASNVPSEEAASILISLTKTRGFFLNLAFLDSEQKKVFETVIKRIEESGEVEDFKPLKESLSSII